jgi:hypothetical protein
MTLNLRTELLFPPRLIVELKDLRGDLWRELVERVFSLPETDPGSLAFCLTMIRLSGCLTCFSGSYRFMRGCYLCTQQAVARYQGTDEELLQLYERSKHDLGRYLDYLAGRIESPEPGLLEWLEVEAEPLETLDLD